MKTEYKAHTPGSDRVIYQANPIPKNMDVVKLKVIRDPVESLNLPEFIIKKLDLPIGAITWTTSYNWASKNSGIHLEENRHRINFNKNSFEEIKEYTIDEPLPDTQKTFNPYVASSYENKGYTKDQIVELICVKEPHWKGEVNRKSNIPSRLVKGSITWVNKARWFNGNANIEDNRHQINFDKSCFQEVVFLSTDMKGDSEYENKITPTEKLYVASDMPSNGVQLICVNTPTIDSAGRVITNSTIKKGDVTWVRKLHYDSKGISYHLENNKYKQNFKREDFKLFVPEGGSTFSWYPHEVISLSSTPSIVSNDGMVTFAHKHKHQGYNNNVVKALPGFLSEVFTTEELYTLTPESYHPDFSKMNDINI
tara:strand:- start:321 stop:1421 length:1101 start_codon:yes stop_codon:yes gene_type:complete